MRVQSSAIGLIRRLGRSLVMLVVGAAVLGLAAPAALAQAGHARHHGKHTRRHHHRHRLRGRRHGTATHGTATPTRGTTAHGQFIQPASVNANQSSNWSGYNQGSLEQGGTPPKLFTSIGAHWTVPTASQHTAGQAGYSSDWIGIGGGCVDSGCTVTDSTLIQTGTEQDVAANGSPSYSAWWEIIPGPSLTITNMTIHPGDSMSASINESLPGLWTISISDSSDGQSYTTTVPYTSTESTAEWIQETPLILGTSAGFAALPNLSSPKFDLASTNGAPANLKSSEEMDLVDSSGNVIGAPSAPDPDADGFNACTWASTCAAPTSS